MVTYGSRFFMDEKAMPELKKEDLPDVDFKKLENKFLNNAKNNKSKRAGLTLTKSILTIFHKDLLACLITSALSSAAQLYSPILNHNII